MTIDVATGIARILNNINSAGGGRPAGTSGRYDRIGQALRRLIGDPAERRRLATNARAAAAQLPTWQDSAQLFARAIETVG